MSPTPRKRDTSWGGVATWYDDLLETEGDTYQAQVILPNLLRILNLKQGERVIDIACGQGFFARACQEAGASVVGADISKELITKAAVHSRKIPLHVAPADNLAFAKSGDFDTALIVLALQNMENMKGALTEAARVLKGGGRLVLVLNHPAFRIPKHSGWGFDDESKTQFRRVDRYLSGEKVKIDMHPGKGGSSHTVSYHHSLQDVVKALHGSGLVISRLEEWISHKKSGKGPRQKAEDAARKEIPLFMMIEAVRP